MDFNYFTKEYAIEVHDEIVRNSGGLIGIKDEGLLESSLEHLKNDEYYPTLEEKLAHLIFSINKNHCFVDGNKRASLVLATYFLKINGLDFLIFRFTSKLENYIVYLAESKIDKELFLEIITSLLYEPDFSELLKLKILSAIDN